MKRKYWTLLVIAAAEGGSLTPAQLQKSLFLISKRNNDEALGNFYSFEAYDYGPFSIEVYQDAEELADADLIMIQKHNMYGWKMYSSTPSGISKAEEISQNIPGKVFENLNSIVHWSMSISFRELVNSIYEEFPEYRENSVFQN